MKARLALLIIAIGVLTACAGPSLRYKKDVLSKMDAGQFEKAEKIIEENRKKTYGSKNAVLYYLDLSTQQGARYDSRASLSSLTNAGDITEELFTRSVSAAMGTLIINDNTTPYVPPLFERSLMYFYRAADYLSLGSPREALVEANAAVFMLDKNRESKPKDLYNDDAFVQYFSSMIYEDNGKISDARIARSNAKNAYERQAYSSASMPYFSLPNDYRDKGEAVIFHYNGKVPVKVSNSIMLAWDDIWFAVEGNSDLAGTSQGLINAVYAGAFGNSITVSFPEYVDVPYDIKYSEVSADGAPAVRTQLVSDIAWQAKQNLKQDKAALFTRSVTRAVTKYILSVQARHIAEKNIGEDAGFLVGSLFSIFSNVTEKADTRSWFTLPAEIRMASLFLPPGVHDIKIRFMNGNGQTIDEYVFENVQIIKGKRTYLYNRTSK